VIAVRLPAEPSRHRVAVWRELRRAGALPLGPAVWVLPATPAFLPVVERAVRLVERGTGEAVVLDAVGHDESHGVRLEAQFSAAREEEWGEFLAECGKYEAELDREVAQAKLTLAELDEEEQSLERLRRWYRELKLRDVFGAPSAAEAGRRLKQCARRLEAYADLVYGAVHENLGATPADGSAGAGLSPADATPEAPGTRPGRRERSARGRGTGARDA